METAKSTEGTTATTKIPSKWLIPRTTNENYFSLFIFMQILTLLISKNNK